MAFNQSEGGDGVAPLHNVLLVYKPTSVKHQRNFSRQRKKQGKIPGEKEPQSMLFTLKLQNPTERGGCCEAVLGL